jgi:transposase-like protein
MQPVSLDGEKDILGLWAGTGGEGVKFWMAVRDFSVLVSPWDRTDR